MKSIIEKDDSWPIRIILETYALALDTPLRVYKVEEAKKYYTYASKLELSFKDCFPSQKDFEAHIEKMAVSPIEDSLNEIIERFNGYEKINEENQYQSELWKKVRDIHGDYWYSYRINSYPLLRALNEHWCWKWWLFCWHYYHFILCDLSDEVTNKGLGFKNEQGEYYLHLSYKYVPELNSVLVAGQAWSPPQYYTLSDINEQVTDMVSLFVKQLKACSQEKPEGEVHYDLERLIRMGNSRFPISTESLEDRLEQIIDALRCLIGLTLPSDTELLRPDYTSLATWSLFSIRTTRMMQIQSDFQHLQAPNDQHHKHMNVYYRLDHSPLRGDGILSHWISTQFYRSRGKKLPKLEWVAECPTNVASSINPKNVLISPVIYTAEEDNESLIKITLDVNQRINNLFERFLSEVFTKYNESKQERLLILREWMNDWFGIFSESPQEVNNNLENISGRLAFEITRFMQADIATLYRYNHGDETLILLNLYHHGGKEHREWKTKEPKHMRAAGKNDDMRQQSICYRAVDSHNSQFCGAYDSKHKHPTLPQGQTLLNPPLGLDSHQSGLASPLLFYGRVWGVVEVLGDKYYQFCSSNQRLMNEITSVLSNYFYYQWFLNKLYILNQIIIRDELASDESDTKKYNDVCQCLSDIFLSYGAGLWAIDPEEGKYRCLGVYNHPGLCPGKEIIKPSDKKTVLGFTLKEMQKDAGLVWWQKKIGQMPLDKEWQKKPRNRKLIEEGIKSVCCIPARLQNEQPIMIVLYNKTTEAYDKRWKGLVSFVAQEVALLLQALHAKLRWEEENRSFIVHELKSGASMILDRAKNIEAWYQAHAWRWARHLPTAEESNRLSILVKDITIHGTTLEDTVKLLGQSNFRTHFRPSSNAVVENARRLLDKKPDFLNLRDYFNNVFRSEWYKQKDKSLSIDYKAKCEPKVLIHRKNLNHILSNLLENAIKYSVSHTTVEAATYCNQYGVQLQIINVGMALEKAEEYRLFQDGYRGQDAVAQGIQGEGKGLFLVQCICDLYGIEIRYESEPISKYCKHIFILSFPLNIVTS